MSEEAKRGRVFLIGAGPGAPGLLTLRGRDCLAAADVVVYDALINRAVLRYAPYGAERIDAGKRAGAHKMSQEEINACLVEHALKGKTVARVKGGDPFLFGRGGEEARALEAEGIHYEVVPGVSSAYAVPAYAGIPLTQRGVASSVHIFTAQGADRETEHLRWGAAAKLGGTLVFLMGFGRIADICSSLMEAGMVETTPVAVVQWGTTVNQRQVYSNLAETPDVVREAELGSPAIVVVGPLADRERRFRWSDALPLFGRTVGFTRDASRDLLWMDQLEGMGARVLDFPLVHTEPKSPSAEIDSVIGDLHSFDWVVFTNSLAVEMFFSHLRRLKTDARKLAGVQFAVVGPGTAQSLEQFGMLADFMPERMSQEGLAGEMPLSEGMRVLLPGSQHMRSSLEDAVRRVGGESRRLPLYDTFPLENECRALGESLRGGELDALVIMTPRAASMLIDTEGDPKGLLADTRVICLGRQAARIFDEAGRPVDAVLPRPTLEDLVDDLRANLRKG